MNEVVTKLKKTQTVSILSTEKLSRKRFMAQDFFLKKKVNAEELRSVQLE